MSLSPTRRGALVSGLSFGASAAIAGCDGRRPGADPTALTLWGPPAGPSITLAFAVAEGLTDFLAGTVKVGLWRSPDELRAGLVSGSMEVAVAPLNTVANLYNRGQDVRLLNVMTEGLLYVVSADRRIAGIGDLRGRTLAVPYRRDAPEVVLKRLLSHHRLDPGTDLEIRTTGSPVEAAQLMLTGRVDAALVPEPAASGAVMAARALGRRVARVIDIQAEWRAMSGQAAGGLPQAGLAVTGRYLARNAGRLARLNPVLAAAAAAVRADPARAASIASGPLRMPAPVLEQAVRFSNLTAVAARDARPQVERYFTALNDLDAAILGGKLPDDAFYL